MKVSKLKMQGVILLFCALFLCVLASSNDEVTVSPAITQPCRPYDSCQKRCVKKQIALNQQINVTLGHLNCFCDQDCETFGDCCWDYQTECVPRPGGDSSGQLSAEGTPKSTKYAKPSNNAFECVVVDDFSKGSYWMITKCDANWPDDVTRHKCTEITNTNFASKLPVLGSTGWTYRNAFCAQCNYVEDISFWSLKAQCVRSAPDEVLSGDPDMISYYFKHFCSTEVMQDSVENRKEGNQIWNREKIVRETIKWKRSLRSCEKSLIQTCPNNTSKSASDACASYQSIIIARSKNDPDDEVLFKNPICAMCHGYTLNDLQHIVIQPKVKDTRDSERNMYCPVWIWTKYYDKAFWTLDSASTNQKLLPAFNNNYKTSSWAPPSFAVLMRFKEDGSIEMVYDDGMSTVTIPPKQECNVSEIYDPFYGHCRYVFCTNGLTFTENGCVDASASNAVTTVPSLNSTHTNMTITDNAIAATITVTIQLPMADFTNGFNSTYEVGDSVVKVFEGVLNTSTVNATVNEQEKSLNESDESVNVTVSFIIVSPGNYTQEEILEITDALFEKMPFQEMTIQNNIVVISVVESKDNKVALRCSEDSYKLIYNYSQYITTTYDGDEIIFVNETESYYMNGEYQMLDWRITITEDGTSYSSLADSRVAVCELLIEPPLPPVCNIYLPLNQSEYVVLANGSLWMEDRQLLIDPDTYIPFGDSVAVCIDGYTPPEDISSNTVDTETEIDPVVEIINWCTFGLTLFSLLSLFLTFLTYLFFSELRTVAGRNLINLVVALFASQLLFLIGSEWTNPPSVCTMFTILLHYLFLATFFWNNVMAYDVWLTFGQGIDKTFRRSVLNRPSIGGHNSFIRRTQIKYMFYGWGMPGLFVGVCAILEFCVPTIYFGYSYDPSVPICWITNPTANLIAFGVPLGAILVCNSVFFVLSIVSIRKVTSKKYRKRYSESVPPLRHDSRLPSFKIPETLNEAPPSSPTSDPDDEVFTQVPSPSIPTRFQFTTQRLPRRRHASTGSMVAYKQSMGLARVNILLYVKMSSVMGFTWALGFAAVVAETPVLWYIFEISVPLQGVFILVSFVCKRRILKLYSAKFGCARKPGITGHTYNQDKGFKVKLRKIFFLPISRNQESGS